ncbi:hypothetical protein NFO65_30435 [Neorhizobium galegae]|uniref:hypothetical protein n=1 Tax=Neorhizobium galegae TaxID=399 RepID=UPI0021007E8A|nr:hypothetical protein [Neorhizobium galegae]MCQ1575027.1 hypothetical protein [Neorhizobium galegae]
MRPFGTLLSAALLAVVLASCNTTEALTPQANVGGGARASSPVTQAETDRMASSAQPETYSGGYRSGPQNTLEAQARALESGSAVSPSSSGAPPQWEGQGNQGQQQTMQQPQAQQPATAAAPPRQQSTSLPPASGPTVRFLPIIGAPVQAVTPLSRQLGTQARANGLTIRPSSDSSTEHILKGYFSAFSDSGKVTIVYVWDILDGSGARLHRMQGQESVPGSGQDPWTSVPASTMETIAAKTIQDYVAWRQSQG